MATATAGENYIETVWGRGYVLRDQPTPENAGATRSPSSATAVA